MARPPFIDVVVHESVHPDALAAELREGLLAGEVATRQHYVGVRQARLWREIALAFSPSRDESDGARAYDVINGLIGDRVAGSGAHVVGLGCGDGAKERRLLDALAGSGPLTATAVDVSLPLVQLSVDRFSAAAGTALGRPVVCDLGLAAADLPSTAGPARERPWVGVAGLRVSRRDLLSPADPPHSAHPPRPERPIPSVHPKAAVWQTKPSLPPLGRGSQSGRGGRSARSDWTWGPGQGFA